MSKNALICALGALSLCCAQSVPNEGPVTLEGAIQEALAKNLDLAAEKANVSVVEARRITANLRPNPILTVSGQTLNILGATYSPNTPLGPNQLNIHTDFPIERGKKRQERLALAQTELSMAELSVREVMRQVIFATQGAFVDVQQAKANLNLAQENLLRLQDLVSINEARLKSGDLAQVELDRSRLALLQAQTNTQQVQLQLDQAKSQLQQLMGRRIKAPDFDVDGTIRRVPMSKEIEELRRLALSRRPDYLITQQSQARSQADLKLQIANAKVDFSVGTEFTRQAAWGVAGNSVGLYVSAPLPFFNRNQGEIARAQRDVTRSGTRIESAQASIESELERAYRQNQVSQKLVESIEAGLLTRAKSVRDTTEYSYRRGEASLIELLDAQRAFNEAIQTYNDARADYARSLYLIDAVSAETVSGS
jgi:outer membrane protein, heavy metal efflux system